MSFLDMVIVLLDVVCGLLCLFLRVGFWVLLKVYFYYYFVFWVVDIMVYFNYVVEGVFFIVFLVFLNLVEKVVKLMR